VLSKESLWVHVSYRCYVKNKVDDNFPEAMKNHLRYPCHINGEVTDLLFPELLVPGIKFTSVVSEFISGRIPSECTELIVSRDKFVYLISSLP
jgi:hypothetical protein